MTQAIVMIIVMIMVLKMALITSPGFQGRMWVTKQPICLLSPFGGRFGPTSRVAGHSPELTL